MLPRGVRVVARLRSRELRRRRGHRARAPERFLDRSGRALHGAQFSPQRVDVLARDTYADDVYFNDGLKAVDGLETLRRLVDLHPSNVELARELSHQLAAIAPASLRPDFTAMMGFLRETRRATSTNCCSR